MRDLTQACMTFKETLTRTEGGGGGGGDDNMAYFAGQERMMLHNAIQVLLLATGRIDPWAIQCFISGSAISLAETGDAQWQQSYHYQTLQEAKAKAREGRGTARFRPGRAILHLPASAPQRPDVHDHRGRRLRHAARDEHRHGPRAAGDHDQYQPRAAGRNGEALRVLDAGMPGNRLVRLSSKKTGWITITPFDPQPAPLNLAASRLRPRRPGR